MWGLLALIVVVAVLGGCAVVLGSGRADVHVDRKIEVASDNAVEVTKPTKETRK